MSKKKQIAVPRKATKVEDAVSRRIVLVGTYKGDQLTKWRGWYNYPVKSGELKVESGELKVESGELKVESGKCGTDGNSQLSTLNFQLINELWLFNGKKDQRNYKAEFVGIKTRQELIDDFGCPAKGKAHGDRYLLFKTDFKYQHKCDVPEDAERVIIRTADFATAPKVRKIVKIQGTRSSISI